MKIKNIFFFLISALIIIMISFILINFIDILKWSHFQLEDLKEISFKDEKIGFLNKNINLNPINEENIKFIKITKYLDNSKAVVVHSLDLCSDYNQIAFFPFIYLNKFGIKATFFINTYKPNKEDWKKLSNLIEKGHELGSHTRSHPCTKNYFKCLFAYNLYQLKGSKEDIIKNTEQKYVWSFAYPCGTCSNINFIKNKLKKLGYFVARTYPSVYSGGHLMPNQQDYCKDSYECNYTIVVQKPGFSYNKTINDINILNKKFDEVYDKRGIYHFMSHPILINYSKNSYYYQHLKYIGNKIDIWYTPLGFLYTYKTIREYTKVVPIFSDNDKIIYYVYNNLNKTIYPNSITLEFEIDNIKILYIKSNNKKIEIKKGLTNNNFDEYYRIADNKLFITIKPDSFLKFHYEYILE